MSSDSEVAKGFLQERLASFGKVIFLLCFGFYLAGNMLRFLGPGESSVPWILRPSQPFHLAASAVLAGMWWSAARGRRSLAALRWIDAAGTVLTCALYAMVGLMEGVRGDTATLLASTNTLIARAVIVPSRPGRTFWIGALACVPGATGAYSLYSRHPELLHEGSVVVSWGYYLLWCGVAIVVSSVASKVIYGLRSEVRQAKRLGQYTLEEKIGAGGMGVVYRAHHAMLRRPTAIKLLHRDQAGERKLARFEREVQLTSRLTHPNTIAIYDYGQTPDGIFYYAMEYVPGLNLDDLIRRHGPQPPGRVIHILKQVCGSLAEAHGTGLIHRDIKAANVILSERGGAHDVVKVVDFGLVKDLDDLSAPDLSAANTITGTPHYLSPEAIRSPGEVGPRSDLYAVGVLGYYLLSGKQVFEAEGFVEVCSHHLQTPPPPLSLRMSAPVPADLERVILGCLEKEAADRPASARALYHALDACESAGEWTEEHSRDWWREHESRVPAVAGGMETASLTAELPAQPATATASGSPFRKEMGTHVRTRRECQEGMACLR